VPRHRIDADTGRAVAAAQLDQVSGVAAADIQDVMTGAEERIGDLVQLLRTCGFEADVELVEQSPERLAVDLGHVHNASIHNRLPGRRTVRRQTTLRRSGSAGSAPSTGELSSVAKSVRLGWWRPLCSSSDWWPR
jgi:hypothetical protein